MTGALMKSMRIVLVVSAVFVALAVGWGRAQTPPAKVQSKGVGKTKVDPTINDQFRKPDVKAFVKRFESEDREVFAKRREIVAALGLRPGMAVADVGAGTGAFTRLLADAVGPEGRVYAVEISTDFLDHIAAQARKEGRRQVVTVRGSQDATNLAPGSVDAAFLCDVYHHFEDHEAMLASIRRALRPGGRLLLVEFDRVEGRSSDFVKKHIRASRAEFIAEVERAGFAPVPGFRGPKLKENFIALFRKAEDKAPGIAPK